MEDVLIHLIHLSYAFVIVLLTISEMGLELQILFKLKELVDLEGALEMDLLSHWFIWKILKYLKQML